MRERAWRRPQNREYPEGFHEGVRAERPNEVWHVDLSLLQLLDGTRLYLHAVLDNFSRRILAWRVLDRLDVGVTEELLIEAADHVEEGGRPLLYADGGVENRNRRVDALVEGGLLDRVIAQVDVTPSNSMIEAWWRSLKHNWLYLNQLDCLARVRRLVAFQVEQLGEHIPHSAFRGQTPDEMYFGTGEHVPQQLAAARATARAKRIEVNRAQRCGVCA